MKRNLSGLLDKKEIGKKKTRSKLNQSTDIFSKKNLPTSPTKVTIPVEFDIFESVPEDTRVILESSNSRESDSCGSPTPPSLSNSKKQMTHTSSFSDLLQPLKRAISPSPRPNVAFASKGMKINHYILESTYCFERSILFDV